MMSQVAIMTRSLPLLYDVIKGQEFFISTSYLLHKLEVFYLISADLKQDHLPPSKLATTTQDSKPPFAALDGTRPQNHKYHDLEHIQHHIHNHGAIRQSWWRFIERPAADGTIRIQG